MQRVGQLISGVALGALVSALASVAVAQETTGTILGQITTAAGAPVSNATVTVIHVPTGSATVSVTGVDGYYSTRGLRVGGPYRVTATAPQFVKGEVTVQQISLGTPATADVKLEPAVEVAELVITAAAAANPRNGPATNYGSGDIDALPTIGRDIKDIARIDPFVTIDPTNQNALSFAGVNTRFNQLTIDGVRQNDDFGLNNNGYPSQRSPISIDTLQAISVSVAPYSVINNGFTGGQINAVTKSGGNQFHGSAWYEKSGDQYRGDSIRGAPAGAPFDEKDWGLTFSGPIIPERLFFFAAYDKYEASLGFDEGPFDLGRSVSIPRISSTAVATLRATAKSVYGYDPGTYLSGGFPVSDEKYLAKVDWNITDDHRLAVTYQHTLGNSLNGSVTSTFAQGNSVTQPAVGLESRDYNKIEELTTYTAQLNSHWTSNFSTEIRYNHKETDTQQNPLAGLSVGQITVNVADLAGVAAGAGTPRIEFGADISRHDNYLNVKVDTVEAIARYHLGIHDFMAGIRTEKDEIFNVFVANSIGSYTFASYADFVARKAATFSLTGGVDPAAGTVAAVTGTARKGAAAFSYRLNSAYAEDRMQILDNLDVTGGVRVDWYSQDDKPILNTSFVSRNGFSNQANLDGKSAVLPRVGFNWQPMSGLTVSGGAGRFSSTGLNVWLSNSFSNTGVKQTNAICPAGPYLNVDLTKAPAGCTFTPGNGNTNALSPGFQIPTVWKTNLTVAYRFDAGALGDNWLVQADILKQTNQNALFWRDLRAQVIGVAPDGRPVYARTTIGTTTGNDFDFILDNTDKGQSRVWAITIGKEFTDGWFDGLSGRFSYTNTRAEDANPMTSSIAQSSYTRFATASANSPPAGRSDYEIRDRFSLDLSYSRKFFGDNKTSVRLFALNRTGLPFSYTFASSRTGNFDNDFGQNVSTYSGRQATSNSLLYVPAASGGSVTATSDPIVNYAPGFDVAAFDTYLKSSGLIGYAGRIVPRNAFNGPDVTTVDLRLSQEFPAFFPNAAKLLVYMDVQNLGNLLNDKWGVLEQYDFYRGVPVVNVVCGSGAAGACAAPGAKYTISGTGVGGAFTTPVKPFLVPAASLWQVKIGAKYKF